MNAPANIPTLATGKVYEPYIAAARSNLEALVVLTQGLRDPAFEHEARFMLEALNEAAVDAEAMIAEDNAPRGRVEWWAA